MNKIELNSHDQFYTSVEGAIGQHRVEITCEACWEPLSESFSVRNRKVHEQLSGEKDLDETRMSAWDVSLSDLQQFVGEVCKNFASPVTTPTLQDYGLSEETVTSIIAIARRSVDKALDYFEISGKKRSRYADRTVELLGDSSVINEVIRMKFSGPYPRGVFHNRQFRLQMENGPVIAGSSGDGGYVCQPWLVSTQESQIALFSPKMSELFYSLVRLEAVVLSDEPVIASLGESLARGVVCRVRNEFNPPKFGPKWLMRLLGIPLRSHDHYLDRIKRGTE
ncbi:MAG: hypothetical protein KDA68_09520 [Planctomycetaceae bacterium]|nr:hypothetical protein [Planctomycetaceae bacterium]